MQYLVSEVQMMDKVKACLKKGNKWMKIEDFDTLRNRWTRKAGVTGWSTKRFDKFMAIQIDKGVFKVAKSCKLGSARERHYASDKGKEDSTCVESATMRGKVEEWITMRATEGMVTHTMCNTMKANLTPKGMQKTAVMAAIILVCFELNLEIESRTTHPGRKGKVTKTERSKLPRDYLHDCVEWAKEREWITQEDAQRVYESMKDLWHTIPKPTRGMQAEEEVGIDLGCGWGGASQGMKKELGRVIGMDAKMQTLRSGDLKAVDILDWFQHKRTYDGGLIKFIEDIGGIQINQLVAIWGSPSCEYETKANRTNKNKPWAKGPHCGMKRPSWEQAGLDTLREGVQEAQKRHKKVQYCMENPAETAIKEDKEWMKFFGEGIIVPGCPYGRKSSKKYHLWMSPATEEEFKKVMIQPKDPESLCEECKNGIRRHQQAQCKKKGDKRPGVSEEGFGSEAANNRVPWRLAKLITKCMKKAFRRG